jgi:hypothetical protein
MILFKKNSCDFSAYFRVYDCNLFSSSLDILVIIIDRKLQEKSIGYPRRNYDLLTCVTQSDVCCLNISCKRDYLHDVTDNSLKSQKPTCGHWRQILSATVLEYISGTVSFFSFSKHQLQLQRFPVLSKRVHPAETLSRVLTIIWWLKNVQAEE